MSRERHWFKCFPEKWLGALAGMKPHVGYTYLIVCLRIYETGHACTDSVGALARRTNMPHRWVRDAIQQLTAKGKLVDTGEGLKNPFAEQLLQKTKENFGGSLTHDPPKKRSKNNKTVLEPLAKLVAETLLPKIQENFGGSLGNDPHKKLNENSAPSLQSLSTSQSSERESKDSVDQRTRLEAVAEAPFAFKRYPKPIDPHWTPSEKNRIDARAAGFADRDIDHMTRAMVLHYRSRGQLLYDMDATWDKWVQNEAHWNGSRGRGKGQRTGSLVDAWDKLSRTVESSENYQGREGPVGRIPERPIR